ncbi:MAG: FmdB family transcriptional regulator [Candidatus Fischerbacteria bacterium RBG_13_37_8]|uniref:FmdB family transcriptional regulator n=1 Tax=Candidatus Fischerbacteria bacterium RBG_13_37_8 TaxID=1817863 RepID=A0A1F5VIA0_9BACT|nr:MAG: FmdB family transcriptional regulator [Candidatus Fischerbacteria bacterium RBG_13_37_8]
MPIYEYRCKDCGKKSSFLIYDKGLLEHLKCKKCGKSNLVRLYSRFSAVRSEDSRLERLADPSSLAGLDENDPKSVAKWMKKLGKEMGEDVGPDFDEEVEKAIEEEATSSGEQADSDEL